MIVKVEPHAKRCKAPWNQGVGVCLSLYVFGKPGVEERFCSVPGSDLTKIIDFNREKEIP